MSNIDQNDRKEDVLYAFHLACSHPTPAQIGEWAKRHPEFADAILEHAEMLLGTAQEGDEKMDVTEEQFARGRSQALDAIFNADLRPAAMPQSASTSFTELMQVTGTSIPKIARQINIGRGVLVDLVQGRMNQPVRRRLLNALATAFKVPVEAIQSAVETALAAPQMGLAKAASAPTAMRRSFDEIVNADPTMDAERKAYWLAED